MGLHVKRFLRYLKKNYRKCFLPEIKFRLAGKPVKDYKQIPIVINNFNRLSMLLRLIDGLESRGYGNLYIIDNGSTYPPLLDWYQHKCPYPVYMLNKNVGHLSIWETGIYKQFTHSWFAYTDSDLEIVPECPDDFMEKFVKLMKKHPSVLKAGFSILIDDLPDCFSHKSEVQKWESQFWKKELEPGVFNAPIDTTFAVYKPYFKGELIDFENTYIRVGKPYSVRHLPWYLDSSNISEEEQYYIDHVRTSTHWSEKEKK